MYACAPQSRLSELGRFFVTVCLAAQANGQQHVGNFSANRCFFFCSFVRLCVCVCTHIHSSALHTRERSYELSDGQFREEEVMVLNRGTDDEEIAVIGSYSFWGSDNELYVTRYTAGRNGYSAHTSHRPRSADTAIEMEETAVWSRELQTVA